MFFRIHQENINEDNFSRYLFRILDIIIEKSNNLKYI